MVEASIMEIIHQRLGDRVSEFHLPPPVFRAMQGEFLSFDLEKGILRTRFPVLDSFLNPYGSMQGGMVVAAVDNTFGPLGMLVASPNVTRRLEMKYSHPITPDLEFFLVTAKFQEQDGRWLIFTADVLNLPVRHNIGPVFPTGLDKKEIHIDQTGQLRKCLKVEKRKMGDSEQGYSHRQALPVDARISDLFKKGFAQARAVQVFISARQLAPEPGLPAVGRVFILFELLPPEKHPGPEHLVLIKKVGDAARQLIQFEMVGVVGQIGL